MSQTRQVGGASVLPYIREYCYRTFSKADLSEPTVKSHENNARLDLTVMLHYQEGHFMQVLEGEDKDVRALYEKIHPTST
jgi:hypothetical protein